MEAMKGVIRGALGRNDMIFKRDVGLIVNLCFHMKRPLHHFTGEERSMANLRVPSETPHLYAPDLDNMQKFILDTLEGIAYPNDKAIVEVHAAKCYDCVGNCTGRTTVEITPLVIDLT